MPQKSSVLVLFLLVIGSSWLFAAAAQPAVKIPVRALDTNGQILSLKLENLQVIQDKEPITPTSFLNFESPVLIAVVFDTTGDMTYIDAIRKELVNFINVLPPGVNMMVLTANDGLKVVQKPTAKKDLLTKAVLNYPTKGYPGFLENVVSVAEYMDNALLNATIRIGILFITDSEIYKYRKQYTSGDLSTEADRDKQLLQETFTPVFVIRLPIGNTDTLCRTYEGTIRDISRSTGGETEFILSPAGVSKALALSLHRIHGTAFVGYTPSEIKPKKEYKLKMEMSGLPADAKIEYKTSFRFKKK